MSLEHIVAGDYGQQIQLTVLDIDTGEAADLSGYDSTQVIILRDPDGNEASKTAAFNNSDGSDGVVQYTLVEDDIDEEGNWRARVRVTSATATLTSVWSPFRVLEA